MADDGIPQTHVTGTRDAPTIRTPAAKEFRRCVVNELAELVVIKWVLIIF